MGPFSGVFRGEGRVVFVGLAMIAVLASAQVAPRVASAGPDGVAATSTLTGGEHTLLRGGTTPGARPVSGPVAPLGSHRHPVFDFPPGADHRPRHRAVGGQIVCVYPASGDGKPVAAGPARVKLIGVVERPRGNTAMLDIEGVGRILVRAGDAITLTGPSGGTLRVLGIETQRVDLELEPVAAPFRTSPAPR